MKIEFAIKIIFNALTLTYLVKLFFNTVVGSTFSPTAETSVHTESLLKLILLFVFTVLSIVGSHLLKRQFGVMVSAIPVLLFIVLEFNLGTKFLALLGKDFRHHYSVGISAPAQFPVFCFEATMTDVANRDVSLPESVWEQSGLGMVGHIHLYEPKLKSLPAYLNMKWYSLVEDRFYTVSTELPSHLFKTYFQAAGYEIDKIILAIKPRGFLSVMIDGPKLTKEIFSATAKQTDIPFESVFENHSSREKFRNEMLNKLEVNAPTGEYYERLINQRRKWNIGFANDQIPQHIFAYYWNGEKAEFDSTNNPLPIPKKLTFQWNSSGKARHFGLNPDDILQFLAKAVPNSTITIKINPEDLSHAYLSDDLGLRTKIKNNLKK